MVDDEDYDLLRVYSWRARRNKATWYAVTDINRKVTRMHRLIMGVTDPAIKVDHDDHNGLNNQRYNLHTSTDLENSANRVKLDGCYSMYKGVARSSSISKPWRAQITINGKKKHLGVFVSEREAAEVLRSSSARALRRLRSVQLPARVHLRRIAPLP